MGIFYKNNGAITVFLSLILVPILILAGISVDAIRIYGAKSILSDSVELTLNTALANYNQVLKDSYGILAMSADENELSNNLIRYFENTINSVGLEFDEEDSYTRSIINDIKNMISPTKELEFNNLLDMETVDFLSKGVEGTQIYNPEVLKRQVIEYMKYRGIISLGSNFMEKLNIFKEVPMQQEYVEAKVEYDSSLSDIDTSCKDVYKAIIKYNKFKQELNDFKIEDFYESSINGNEDFYGIKDINRLLLSLYVNKSFIDDISKVEVSTKELSYYDIYSYLNSNVDNIVNSIEKFIGKENPEAIIKYYFDINSSSADIAKVLKYYKALPDKFNDYCDELIKKFEDEEETRKQEAEKNKITYVPRENTALEDAIAEYNALINAISEPINIINTYCNDMKNRKPYVANLIESNLRKLNLFLHEKYLIAKKIYDNATIAVEKLEKITNEIIPQIEEKNKALTEKLEGLSEGDIKTSLKLQHEDISKAINKNELRKLRDIIQNNKNYYEKYIENLDNTKYLNITFIKTEINPSIADMSILLVFEADNFNLAILNSDKALENNLITPNLSNMKDLSVKSFENSSFYKYLCKTYKNLEIDDSASKVYMEDARTKKENVFNLVNNSIESYENMLNDKKNQNTVPISGEIYEDLATSLIDIYSNEKADDINKLFVNEDVVTNKKLVKDQANSMKKSVSILQALGNFSLELLESSRDKLYITEYIAEMFSCQTTNRGGAIEKTLSGIELNEKNNYLFGSEMEYILWGQKGENTDKNGFYTATSIFGLRFALNTAYAYTDAEIKSFTLAVAVALAGFTGFGVPLVQNVLILSLAMAESAIDVKKLLDGENVVLFKSYTTWMLKPSGITRETISYSIRTITETALTKLSEKIINFAEEKSDEAVNNLEAAFDEYSESLLNDISASISNFVIVPIQTEITLWLETNGLTGAQLNSTIDEIYRNLKNEILKEPESFTKNIKIIVLDIFVEERLEDIKNKINSSFEELENETEALRTIIEGYIENTISELTGNIKTIIFENGYDALKNEVKEGFKNLTDDVKQNASNMIDNFVSRITTGEISVNKPSFKASVITNFTFNYKEYIKLFLFTGMISDKENIYISRMCDLIKLNLVYSENAPLKSFNLKNAYTMVKISAKASVRTTFMRDSFFKNPWNENKYYLTYTSIYGY